VKPGGVVIVFPRSRGSSPDYHPSYIDFFEEVLRGPRTRRRLVKFEALRERPWYTPLSDEPRVHGVPVLWYWGAPAALRGRRIFVGGDPKSVARLGYRTAGTFRDALEMAKDTVGSSPSITYMHTPPLSIADVK
jgi:hypothetical protein